MLVSKGVVKVPTRRIDKSALTKLAHSLFFFSFPSLHIFLSQRGEIRSAYFSLVHSPGDPLDLQIDELI